MDDFCAHCKVDHSVGVESFKDLIQAFARNPIRTNAKIQSSNQILMPNV